jgi:nitroreductase
MSPDALPTGQIGLFDAIYTMRAIREFNSEPIPDAVLRQVLAAAGQAPSGGNRQPWKFIVIRSPEGKGEVAELVQTMQSRRPEGNVPSGTAAPAPDFPGLLRALPQLLLFTPSRLPRRPADRRALQLNFPGSQNLLRREPGAGGNITPASAMEGVQGYFGLRQPDADLPDPARLPVGRWPQQTWQESRLPVEETTFAEKFGQSISFSL